jgi:hypothetical protein
MFRFKQKNCSRRLTWGSVTCIMICCTLSFSFHLVNNKRSYATKGTQVTNLSTNNYTLYANDYSGQFEVNVLSGRITDLANDVRPRLASVEQKLESQAAELDRPQVTGSSTSTSDALGANISFQSFTLHDVLLRHVDLNCSTLLSFTYGIRSDTLHGNVGVEFNGRMGNNMIQYIHGRLQARKRGHGLVKIVNPQSKWGNGQSLNEFARVIWRESQGQTFRSSSLCGGEFAQYYLYLRNHRDFAECLFSPKNQGWYPKHNVRLRRDDIVVHIRDPHGDGEGGMLHAAERRKIGTA